MIVSLKDAAKLGGICIMSCCAVFICTLFMNYNLDLAAIKDQITGDPMLTFYEAQVMAGKMVSGVSGGCLIFTSVVMLFSYIKHYVDLHRKELGILKALGYSNWSIARGFWVFGFSVLVGTALGYFGSFALMPTFYDVMNEDKILPDVAVQFHVPLLLLFVALPSLIFALLSCVYGWRRLKYPVLELLTGKTETCARVKAGRLNGERSFLEEMRKSTVRSRTSLAFFVAFGAFCYSAMMQMSFGMRELSSELFAAIMIISGVVLSFTALFLAISTVVRANTKPIAMMGAMGYSWKERTRAVLSGYRPIAYLGAAAGTVYQYAILKLMVEVVYRDISGVPDYSFDWKVCILVLATFLVIYELLQLWYAGKLKRITLKEIMLD